MRCRRLPLVFALVGVIGCAAPPPARSSGPPLFARDPAAVPASRPAARNPHSGALEESAFKKLHALRGESAPPRAGVDLELADGSRAYLSLPSTARAPLPGLVVVHEWWGLNEHIQHWADRLAADGYAALAVDLFRGEVATTSDRALELVQSVEPKAARATLLAAHRFLASDARVRAQRRGAIGWCFGGKQALELALAAPDLDAIVLYYGHVPTERAALASLQTPVLGIFGRRDASIPESVVQAFDATLSELSVPHRILVYDADHAFANPSGTRYDAAAAEPAWKEARAFLAQHLKK